MLLRILYRAGLTNLTRDEVDQYEAAVRSGDPIEEQRKVNFWGSIAIGLFVVLGISALGLVSMLKTISIASDLQEKAQNLDKIALLVPYEVKRGGDGEPDPAKTLKRVHDRIQQINQELSTLRSRSIDYSSLGSQRKRLAALNLELGKLTEDAAWAKKKLGLES